MKTLKEFISQVVATPGAETVQIEVRVDADMNVKDNAPNIIRISLTRPQQPSGFQVTHPKLSPEQMKEEIRKTVDDTKERNRNAKK